MREETDSISLGECNPVDAVECPRCSTVFQVRTFATDGAGYVIWDGCEMRRTDRREMICRLSHVVHRILAGIDGVEPSF